ncbi:MAG: GNAT family N-acetyltransferase [Polyangiaceae bacterium]
MTLADPFADGLPTLEGARVRLRPLRREDRGAVFALYCDKDAVRYGFSPKMDTLDDADELIDRTHRLALSREVFHWGAALTETDEIVGHATLFHLEKEHRRAEVGYSVVRHLWGRGIGAAAVTVLVRFAFGALDLRRLEADVDPRNTGSLRLVEKLGFVREGYMRERWELQGEIQDAVYFGLLRREWTG